MANTSSSWDVNGCLGDTAADSEDIPKNICILNLPGNKKEHILFILFNTNII